MWCVDQTQFSHPELTEIPKQLRSSMAYQFSRKGCFKCGNRAWLVLFFPELVYSTSMQSVILPRIALPSSDSATIADSTDTNRRHALLPGPFQRSSAILVVALDIFRVTAPSFCQSKELNVHLAECPSLRIQQGSNQKCYVCVEYPFQFTLVS